MSRPFPLAFSIGNDVCHIPRIRAILTNPFKAERFVNKILNKEEVKNNQNRLEVLMRVAGKDHGLYGRTEREDVSELANFLAGRWAAKEATIKAHTLRRLTMHDISIFQGKVVDGLQQAPRVVVKAATGDPQEDTIVKVSISHDGDYATAVCLAAE